VPTGARDVSFDGVPFSLSSPLLPSSASLGKLTIQQLLAAKSLSRRQVNHVAGNEATVRVDREGLVSMPFKI
jgi:hypothetical protein